MSLQGRKARVLAWTFHIRTESSSMVPSDELDNETASTPVDTSVSINEPSLEDIYAAIKWLWNGHAPRCDSILYSAVFQNAFPMFKWVLCCVITVIIFCLQSTWTSATKIKGKERYRSWRGKMGGAGFDAVPISYKKKHEHTQCRRYKHHTEPPCQRGWEQNSRKWGGSIPSLAN